MSILAGHITVEKLTKFILYSEWLIYSTWWVGDNISNLMQSVGASEKVFHLMDLSPSSQSIERGKHFFAQIFHMNKHLHISLVLFVLLFILSSHHLSRDCMFPACSILILPVDWAWILPQELCGIIIIFLNYALNKLCSLLLICL